MLHLSQQQKLLQKLTPQQIQYLKLLQLPTLALEQMIKTELELNPLLEEGNDGETEVEQSAEDTPAVEEEVVIAEEEKKKEEFSFEDYLSDEESFAPKREMQQQNDDDEKEEIPIAATTPLAEKLLDQLHLADVTDMGMQVAEEIIGNIDEDGYLRRDLESIVNDINLSNKLHLTVVQVEEVLRIIQRLEPVGIASRSLQECLMIQLEFAKGEHRLLVLAQRLLRDHFDEFTKKHYEKIAEVLSITIEEVKKILEIISHLNPKPGEGTIDAQQNYLTPDFIVTKDEETFIIQLNDKNVPPRSGSTAITRN
jgi:RNA polymerase sigma-54 factor